LERESDVRGKESESVFVFVEFVCWEGLIEKKRTKRKRYILFLLLLQCWNN